MASPTAIPNAENSSHHLSLSSSDMDTQSSYSPPLKSSIYTQTTGAFSPPTHPSSIRMPVGINMSIAPSSPTQCFSMGLVMSSPPISINDSSAHHTRTRSQTIMSTCSLPVKETWDDCINDGKPNDLRTVTSSSAHPSYFSAADGSFSRSPTSPPSLPSISSSASANNSGFQPGFALGRVPSLPLGATYEHAQKRFTSGSWSQKSSWKFDTLRGGAPVSVARSPEESNSGSGRAVDSLLRRFSLSTSMSRTPTSVASNSHDSSFSPPPVSSKGHLPRDSGVSFVNDPNLEQPKKALPSPRGRQASLSGNAKRKPSPMGERLLMGHFTAH